MGRPINKRWFGTTGTGTGTGKFTGNNLPIRFKLGGTVYEGYITKQTGSNRYKVSTDDGTTATGTVYLKNAVAPANNGEAALVGFFNGSATLIRDLRSRIAIDYSGVRYKWNLSDDSTETLIILTAI
jgi:hypothetical protein